MGIAVGIALVLAAAMTTKNYKQVWTFDPKHQDNEVDSWTHDLNVGHKTKQSVLESKVA